MKKLVFLMVLLFVFGGVLTACGESSNTSIEENNEEETTENEANEANETEEADTSEEGNEKKSNEEENEATENEEESSTSPDDEIYAITESIISEDLNDVKISEIKVNENMGLDDGSYIVLPHLIWNVKNSAGTTREMIEQYSDHLAAKLAEENVSEITVFWEIPYHSEGENIIKHGYERQGDGMAITEVWHDPIIQD